MTDHVTYQSALLPWQSLTQGRFLETTDNDVNSSVTGVPNNAHFTQKVWCPEHHGGAALAADDFQPWWTSVPSQPAGNQQQAHTHTPLYPGEGPSGVHASWFRHSEDLSFQQHTPGSRAGGEYGTGDSWFPFSLPAPQSPPTGPLAPMAAGQHQPPCPAPEAQATYSAFSPLSEHRKARNIQTRPPRYGSTPAQKESQSTHADTTATPPDEEEINQVNTPNSKWSGLGGPKAEALAKRASGKTSRVKNSAAAKRCRDKSRQFEMDLAAREKQLAEDHMYLETSAAALRAEVLALKNQILQHGDCNCEVIQAYISKVANQVSRASVCQQDLQR